MRRKRRGLSVNQAVFGAQARRSPPATKQPTTMMNGGSSLHRLLELAAPLHHESSKLTLSQLVPVHFSLLQAVLADTNVEDHDASEIESLDTTLHLLLDHHEEGKHILQQRGNVRQKLLVLQRLLFMFRHDPLHGLAVIVLPYLLQEGEEEKGDESNRLLDGKDDEKEEEELREALLDAVFETQTGTTVAPTHSRWLEECLGRCQNERPSLHSFTTTCRVLVRLHAAMEASNLLVTVACFEKVSQGLDLACSISSKNEENEPLAYLKPVTSWILPLLFGQQSDEKEPYVKKLNDLWTYLWQIYTVKDDESSKQLQVRLLAVSAILCGVLPSLLMRQLPDPSCIDKQSSLASLILETGLASKQKNTAREQIIRRRSLYLLKLVVESTDKSHHLSLIWNKYLLCMEALEMETEPHLFDQVWDTVADLCVEAATPTEHFQEQYLPAMSWRWIKVLLSSALFSETPILRKIAIFRFLRGDAGIRVAPETSLSSSETRPGSSKKKAAKGKREQKPSKLAPLTFVSPDFVLDVLLPSFDTLAASVGTNMKHEETGKVEHDDLIERLSLFLGHYMQALMTDAIASRAFLSGLWSQGTVCRLKLKLVVQIFRTISDSLGESSKRVHVDEQIINDALTSFQELLGVGSIVSVYRESLLESFARMLSHSTVESKIDPKILLRVISLYPISSLSVSMIEPNESADVIEQNTSYGFLQTWVSGLDDSPEWASTVATACASAFVTGQLFPRTEEWNAASGSTRTERCMGAAISLLCVLSCGLDGSKTAGSLVWPAIHKALSNSPRGNPWINADRATRGLILLENGCLLGVLSGMGNGDLVVDAKTHQMLPPPPNIETILENAVGFIMGHVKALCSFESNEDLAESSGSTRSGDATRVSSTFANVISQVQTLKDSYPSSMTVAIAVNEMLKQSIGALPAGKNHDSDSNSVLTLALAYAALSFGADPIANNGEDPASQTALKLLETCRSLLTIEFFREGIPRVNQQTARSVFQYAKWGALSCTLLHLTKVVQGATLTGEQRGEINSFLSNLFELALDSVHATPSHALLPLFSCIILGTKTWLADCDGSNVDVYTRNLEKVRDSLFTVLEESSASGREAMYMLNETCALLFQPSLLLEEFEHLDQDSDAVLPIRDAFRDLKEKAGTGRPHISRAAVSRLSVTWLGGPGATADVVGLGAIPYREDIFSLLLHKEDKLEEASMRRDDTFQAGVMQLPTGTSESSIVQGFVLMFLDKLPHSGLSPRVETDLLQYVILRLLEEASVPVPKKGTMMVSGTAEYCVKIRSWQALCVLSRFVNTDISQQVCDKTFECLEQNLHAQIRYFMECFVIQSSRKHPAVFGRALVMALRRNDLSLHHVSSLMIIAGNLVVGRYKIDFSRQFQAEEQTTGLQEILAGTLPWLSSTQGFSRAIAQLLVHKLIPMVIDINQNEGDGDSDWFLRSIFNFLDENSETKRLRKKQIDFFEKYNVDEACTAEGILRIQVDEGNEAKPEHLIDAIKKVLQEVYLESHEQEAPMWKQVEEMLHSQEQEASALLDDSNLVNFQRKIIPTDSLDLTMQEAREKRLRNAAGRTKQQLVICATLVDKVPNLAGLARTAEIFAATQLVIPDKTVVRMDNFKSISVGAEQWIEIEECKEDALLTWLRRHKADGYTIVGVEQTSSSSLVTDFTFPERCVLLLGKEKEGIPVQFLQHVDICVEIPQFGVLRSLNVHVTAALAIWEYTKQAMQSSKK